MSSPKTASTDYALSGMSIWRAMLAHGRSRPRGETGPIAIRWDDKLVQTADVLSVPREGRLRIEILTCRQDIRQGIDVKMNGGCVLADGELVPLLRTWCDPEYDPVIEYEYRANDLLLSTWNVYMMSRGQEEVAERWTGNAGFWIEELSQLDRIYHCSPGPVGTPDFDSLVYRLSIHGLEN